MSASPNEQSIKVLEKLVTERQDWLFRFAYMRIGKREDAEDIVQEVFMSLFQMIRIGKDIKELDRYMIRSVSNACHDYKRQQMKRAVSIDKVQNIPVCETDGQIHEEFLRINRLLDDLPAEQSETVRLKCYDNLTFRQIAELQGISEATVKSRYRYAIVHIQKRLQKGRNDE